MFVVNRFGDSLTEKHKYQAIELFIVNRFSDSV